VTSWAPEKSHLELSREAAELAAGHHSSAAGDDVADALHEPAQTTDVDVFDLAALKARVEDDVDLMAEMIELHLHNSPQLLAEIESAVAFGHRAKLIRASHTLKGVLKSMCANRSAQAALQLEILGNSGELKHAGEAFAELKSEFEQLQTALKEVVEEVRA